MKHSDPMNPTMAAARVALAELPDSADGIAERFEELGIGGYRHIDRHCPMANYLRLRTGVMWRVDAHSLMLYGHGCIDTTKAIRSFIYHFDCNRYEFLQRDE